MSDSDYFKSVGVGVAKNENTEYQATEDGFVVAAGANGGGAGLEWEILCDNHAALASPADRVIRNRSVINSSIPAFWMVKKGYYWKAVPAGIGGPTYEVMWIPIE